MRTTLDLDPDILFAAKALGGHTGQTLGQVISDLVRKALAADKPTVKVRNGVPLLPSEPGRIVTPQMVEDAQDHV